MRSVEAFGSRTRAVVGFSGFLVFFAGIRELTNQNGNVRCLGTKSLSFATVRGPYRLLTSWRFLKKEGPDVGVPAPVPPKVGERHDFSSSFHRFASVPDPMRPEINDLIKQ